MQTPKHTPGPWHLNWECRYVGRFTAETVPGREDKPEVGGIIARVHDADTHQGKANARLIAAAPELLQALLEMMRQFEPAGATDEDLDAITLARAAIAKARGGN